MYCVGENLTPKTIAESLSRVSGVQWDTEHWTREAFMKLQNEMDHELWLNYLAFVNQ